MREIQWVKEKIEELEDNDRFIVLDAVQNLYPTEDLSRDVFMYDKIAEIVERRGGSILIAIIDEYRNAD